MNKFNPPAVPQLEAFTPPTGMTNPHMQTMLSSVARKLLLPRREADFLQAAVEEIVETNGVKLRVDLNVQDATADAAHPAPLIMIIPGWLGNSCSSYVLSSAKSLFAAGYSVARINLRDHGDTVQLNPGLFNSALIDEVVQLTSILSSTYGSTGAGLMGFSLGGNFALRVARAIDTLPVLAICPAIAPADTMHSIDRNVIYQRYFVAKWRNNWLAKQHAFPDLYNFSAAMRLTTVSALTDYFIRYHSGFATAREYFAAYDLSGDALADVKAHILAAADDPIIPATQYQNLPDSISLELTRRGGHGAYLESWGLDSWADRYAIKHFNGYFADIINASNSGIR